MAEVTAFHNASPGNGAPGSLSHFTDTIVLSLEDLPQASTSSTPASPWQTETAMTRTHPAASEYETRSTSSTASTNA